MKHASHFSLFEKAAAIGVAIGIAIASPAFAFSSGGSSSGAASTPACKTGYVWDAKKNSCVKATSGLLDDKQIYTQGRDLALAGRYQEALDALGAVKNKDSMTLTMIGYATRKMGNYNQGLAYYQQALALDSNNVSTREYLGEAYAEKGHIDLANAELVKVEALCGTECEQYQDLAKAIASAPVSN
jgi:tetratricopeptide (TPR) repeat protein